MKYLKTNSNKNYKNITIQGFRKLALSLMLSLSLLFFAFCATNYNLFAVDSVVVQTFTFEDIVMRQAKFQFPDANEKFSKVIGKYRLKCDANTTQDNYNCGEWDYLTYTKIVKPTGEFRFSDKKHPKTTFGSFLLPNEGKALMLTSSKVKDRFEKNNFKTTVTTSNTSQHTVNSGNETNDKLFKSNYQFLLLAADLKNAGLENNSKIGKITLEGNIVDTIENVIIRASRISGQTLNDYFTGNFDTVAIQSLITPADCINNKITINFLKNLVWNGTSNYCFEMICEHKSKFQTKNTFKGITNGQAILAVPFSSAILDGDNGWIDIDSIPAISGKQHFTFEGWINLNKNDANVLNGNIIFSLGDKIIVRLNSPDTAVSQGFRVEIEMFDETAHVCRTVSRVIRYDTWTHIAVAFDGTARTAKDRIRTYINGSNTAMEYSFWGYDGWAGSIASFVCETPATLAIGRGIYYGVNDAVKNLKAKIADVRIWNATIAANEISDWYKKKIDNTHPNYSNLLLNYLFEDAYNSRVVTNGVTNTNKLNGKVIGNVSFSSQNFGLQYAEKTNFVPNITFEVGDFEYQQSNEKYFIEKEQIPVSIVNYNTNPQISYPTIATVEYFYKPVITTYDVNGNVVKEENVSVTSNNFTVGNELFDYRAKGSPIYKEMEIARFITPYGRGLNLGTNGFEWEYDFTDYMNELRGEVIIVAHNWQELIDLKFIFYKGEPTREILRVSEPWGSRATYLYKNLVNDVSIKAATVDLLPETKSVKLKTRISGHGMVFDTVNGVIRQCCEFYANDHRILAGSDLSKTAARWRIWQDCDYNPVYPQGGTWSSPREGWCPGDIVKDYEYELTPYIENQKITIDYTISASLFNGFPKTGEGNYRMNFHLVEYGKSKYQNDLELYKIISPSTEDIFRRVNPICNGVKFLVRNNTDSDINNFTVVLRNNTATFSKNINLQEESQSLSPFRFDSVTVFIDDPTFWAATSETNPEIEVEISLPNGTVDDNHSNDIIKQKFNLPDIYDKNNFVIRYRSNRRPGDYELKIYDFNNNVVKTFKASAQETTYNISLNDLPYGCYTLKLEDRYYYGLSYWAVPAQGNGSFGLYDGSGKTLKTFNADFGKYIIYSFVLNGFTSIKEDKNINLSLYPNPTNDFIVIQSYESLENVSISVYDISGRIVLQDSRDIVENEAILIDVTQLLTGTYSVRVEKGNRVIWNKFIKQ